MSPRVRRGLLLIVTLLGVSCRSAGPLAGHGEREDIVYRRAAVACDHPVASQAGVEMLRRGGNAIDAAVAASFTLSVVRPYSCGIGGGGFMVIHEPGRNGEPPVQLALNYRETAPAAVGSGYYEDLYARTGDTTLSRFGPYAAGVPGTVAGLIWALEHYGTLDRATVLAPAIRAAEEGVIVDASYQAASVLLAATAAVQTTWRDAAFLRETVARHGGLRIGDRVRNPAQARVLRLIAEHGHAGFYTGEVAEAIVEVVTASGGPMSLEDLAGYEPRVVEPLRGRFRGRAILAMPPPSSGGVAMLQVLGLLDRRLGDLGEMRHNDAAYVHLVTEAMKHAFADRAQWLADPVYAEVPTGTLLDRAYLDGLAAAIDLERTRGRYAYGSVEPAPADSGTSHLSVVDADGRAVACTETINTTFGSLVTVPGLGFVLNNEMDDFTTVSGRPNVYGLTQSDRNLPQPGKRPLSSMSPTIVLENGSVALVAGASGGPRIITGTLQCLLNCMLFDMSPGAAVEAPRFHHQWMPEVLQLEASWTDETVRGDLERRGHEVGARDEIGVVQLIRVTDDGIRAASDPRKGGRPAGY